MRLIYGFGAGLEREPSLIARYSSDKDPKVLQFTCPENSISVTKFGQLTQGCGNTMY